MPLFKSWENKDPVIRKKWIKEKADENKVKHKFILEHLASKDQDLDVCTTAINKISDQFLLGTITVHNPRVIEQVMEKVKDQEALKSIAGNRFNHARFAAVHKIIDQDILKKILLENKDEEDFRFEILKKITDDKFITDFVLNEGDRFFRWKDKDGYLLLRSKAVRKIRTPDFLNKIIENSQYEQVKITAKERYVSIRIEEIEDLADQSLLIKIASEDKYSSIREAAVKKIQNPEVIIEIARNDKSSSVRKMAVEMIQDQAIISDFAKNDKSSSVRKIAFDMIKDSAEVSAKVLNDKSDIVRAAAVKKSEDQEKLAEVALKDKNEEIRIAAVKKISDEKLLSEIAKNIENESVGLKVVGKISDQVLLVDIALHCNNAIIRKEVVDRVKDHAVLSEIGKNDQFAFVRSVAIEKIENQDDLAFIVRNDEKFKIRVKALQRMNHQVLIADLIKNEDFESKDAELYSYLNIGFAKISDQNLLKDIAVNALHWIARLDAVKKMAEDIIPQSITRKEMNSKVRNEAIRRIKFADREIVVRLIKELKSDNEEERNDSASTLYVIYHEGNLDSELKDMIQKEEGRLIYSRDAKEVWDTVIDAETVYFRL